MYIYIFLWSQVTKFRQLDNTETKRLVITPPPWAIKYSNQCNINHRDNTEGEEQDEEKKKK